MKIIKLRRIGFFVICTIVFVVLKLYGIIDWKWFWPLLIAIFILLEIILGILKTLEKKKEA